MIFMLKGRVRMSREKVERYYEDNHARLGGKHAANAARYARRDLKGSPAHLAVTVRDPDFDVVRELSFETQADVDAAMSHPVKAEAVQKMAADQDKLFDRPRTRVCLMQEVDSPVRAFAHRGLQS